MGKSTQDRSGRDSQSGGKPMDDSVVEKSKGEVTPNHPRTCKAALTLVEEVHSVFPETPVSFSGADRRNTALDATFDLGDLDKEDTNLLKSLLELTDWDKRVDYVLATKTEVLVSFKSSLRTQDNQEPFGIDKAFDIYLDETL